MADVKGIIKELYEKIREYAREAESISYEEVGMISDKELTDQEIEAFVEGASWAFGQVENLFNDSRIEDLIEKETEHEEPKAEGESKKE
jgi:hypothetical protein